MAAKKPPFRQPLPPAGEPARSPEVPRDGAPSPPSHATHAPPLHPPHRLAIQVFGQQNAQRHVGDSCCSRLAMILCAPRSLPRRLARRRRPHGHDHLWYRNGRPQFDALALFVKRRVSRFHPPARDGASFGHKHIPFTHPLGMARRCGVLFASWASGERTLFMLVPGGPAAASFQRCASVEPEAPHDFAPAPSPPFRTTDGPQLTAARALSRAFFALPQALSSGDGSAQARSVAQGTRSRTGQRNRAYFCGHSAHSFLACVCVCVVSGRGENRERQKLRGAPSV